MPEQRGREHHRNRIAETLREEISILIGGELSDPRIGSATVTEVALNPGGKSGQVYVAVEGDEGRRGKHAGRSDCSPWLHSFPFCSTAWASSASPISHSTLIAPRR